MPGPGHPQGARIVLGHLPGVNQGIPQPPPRRPTTTHKPTPALAEDEPLLPAPFPPRPPPQRSPYPRPPATPLPNARHTPAPLPHPALPPTFKPIHPASPVRGDPLTKPSPPSPKSLSQTAHFAPPHQTFPQTPSNYGSTSPTRNNYLHSISKTVVFTHDR
jgi:hypothetical protein